MTAAGVPSEPDHPAREIRRCEVAGCQRVHVARGMCLMHWTRDHLGIEATWERVGSPSGHGLYGTVLSDPALGILCNECGEFFQALGGHVHFKHQLSLAEYRARHGLPRSQPLATEQTRAKISAATLQGFQADPDRRARWEQGRQRNHAKAVEAAREARPADGAIAYRRRKPRKARTCQHCHTPLDAETPRTSRYCGPECANAARKALLRRQRAQRAGEAPDFVANPGAGDKITADTIETACGIKWSTWRTYVHRGSAPTHDGRVDGLRFWWASTITAWLQEHPHSRATS